MACMLDRQLTEVRNKPSNSGLLMKESWGPACSREGSLVAKLRQDVTMNGRDWMWRLRMKM